MQTLEPYVEQPGNKKPPLRGQGRLIAALVILVPLSLLLIQTKVGVAIGVFLAIAAGIIVFVLYRGFAFIQVVAFLIHFDGLGRSGITVGRVLASMTLLVMVYKLVVEKWRPPAVPTRQWILPMMLFTWAFISGAWSPQLNGWFYGIGVLSLGLSYFMLGAFMVDSVAKVGQFLRAFWYGGIFASVGGAVGLGMGIRSFGFAGDANFFGLLEASMIPLTVYYRRNSRSDLEKWLYSAVLVLVFVGAAGAGSRSGMIGATAALVATMVTRPGLSAGRRAGTGVGAIFLGALFFAVLFLANPANLERGFADRGAGRLDFWTVTKQVIAERPVIGAGLAQLRAVIPSKLPTTPGVEKLSDSREEVSSHNSWLDMWGDLGVIGLVMFISIYVVTFLSFLRPRWQSTRQLSTTLFVMMIPVLTGSFFLPLSNNKLAWSLIGLAAALQVPSWGTRYKGYFASGHDGDEAEAADPYRPARWDLRVSQRFRAYLLVGALSGLTLFATVISRVPPRYEGSMAIVVPDLDLPANFPYVSVSTSRLQAVHNLILSKAYASALRDKAGLDLSVEEIESRVSVERPNFGPYMTLSFTDTDEATTRRAAPHMLEALTALIDTGRQGSDAQLQDEARPVQPGEQRYYSGDLFLPVSNEAYYKVDKPRVVWVCFVGTLGGTLVALAFVLVKQRHPRVNNDDDFPTAVGMPMWTHVGRMGRRNAASPQQYAQVATMAYEVAPGDRRPSRVLVASPQVGLSTRSLAIGLAASLAASGEKVVLVDGNVEQPWLSWRLGGLRKPGLLDVGRGEADLAGVLRRVRRLRLPGPARRTLRGAGDNLRLIPVGRRRRGEDALVDPSVLERLGPGVITVMVAPSLLGTVPAAPALRWADVVLYCLVEGGTITFEAEDAAVRVRTVAAGPSGVVLADV